MKRLVTFFCLSLVISVFFSATAYGQNNFSIDKIEALNHDTGVQETFVRFQNGNGAAGNYSVTASPSLNVYQWVFGGASNVGNTAVVLSCPDGPIVLFRKNDILDNGGTVNVTMKNTSTNVTFSGVWSSASKYVVTRVSTTDAGGTMDFVVGEDILIIAQLSYADGNPISTPGKTVTWGSTNGGTFSSETSITGSDGRATVKFTPSTTASIDHTVTATDNDAFTGSSGVMHTIAGPATRFMFSPAIGRQIAGKPFEVTIQLQDKYWNPVNFSAGGVLTLTLATGQGILGGTLSAAVQVASNTTTISGVTYSKPEKSNVSLTVTGSGSGSNANGLTGASNIFDVDATLTVTATNGTVLKNPDLESYPCAEIVQLTATPAAGYQFANWSGDATGSTNPIDIEMIANKYITAKFASLPYTVTLSSNPSAGGTTSGGGAFNSGSSVTVTATPSAGYTFTNWTEGATVVSTSASYTFTVGANRTLVANFASLPYTATLSSNPSAGGTTSGGGTFNSGSSVTVTATPSAGYTFTNWTEGATVVSTSASYTFTIGANRTLVANFVINTYTLTITETNGSVTKSPNQSTYNHGTTVQLTAIPNAGYQFASWSGDATGTTNPVSVTMDANKNITANFAVNTYSIAQKYSLVIQYLRSLPDNAFKKPADERRSQLSDMFAQSQSKYTAGNSKAAARYLSQNVTNHLTPQGKNFQNVWVTDETARLTLLSMLNDLLDLLQKPQLSGSQSANGSLAAMVEDIPTEYGLSQNYPNPFNPSTTIGYQLPQAAQVSLKVYNTVGEEVSTLVSDVQNAGFYQVQWAPQLPSGVYFYQLQAGSYIQSRKMILVK